MSENQEKILLRRQLLKQLRSLSRSEIKERSRNVEKNLLSLKEYKQAKIVMVYYPLSDEVDILNLVRRDWQRKEFSFPVVNLTTSNIEPFMPETLDDFCISNWGIREPNTRKAKRVDIKTIDLVVTPALAFDFKKNRLGRGGGFYDRFLKDLDKNTKKVGIGFDFQILPALPADLSYDEKVDIVVGESTYF